jgi:hypothetical protein
MNATAIILRNFEIKQEIYLQPIWMGLMNQNFHKSIVWILVATRNSNYHANYSLDTEEMRM